MTRRGFIPVQCRPMREALQFANEKDDFVAPARSPYFN